MAYARRLGANTLEAVGRNPGDRRPDSFWQGLAKDLAYAMYAEGIGVDKPIVALHFVAQVAHESAGFTAREEFATGDAYDIAVDRKLALALGNVHPGDGRRYKGRSYIQITGRSNYRALPRWDGIDFEKHPERLAEPKYAAKAAAWWWRTHGLNALAADGSDATVEAVTRRINGGVNGLEDRRRRFRAGYENRKYLTPARRPPS